MVLLIPVRNLQVKVPQVVSQQVVSQLVAKAQPKRDAAVVVADLEARGIPLLLPVVSDRTLASSETGSDLNHP